jgi:protein tyrosine/serine phosphatase
MRKLIVIAIAVALTTAVWLTREVQANRLVWDHFDEVKPGILYRSGQLNPDHLSQAVRRYGLKLVVSFQYPGKGVDAERALCKRLGVEFLNLPMPGDGFGREDQFRQVLAATSDPNRRPVLVHCARGTCRTGSSVALYRFERDGWTVEDVSAEMKRQAYRDGWLTGYVFNMIKSRPSDERFELPPDRVAAGSKGGRDER